MKFTAIICSLILFSSNVISGEWTQISSDTLSFKGGINEDELEKFNQNFNSNIKKIIVDSGGGLADAGLSIGEIIAKSNIDIVVQGVCMSSCANYLFTAGKNKIINNGVVGFHGNMTAYASTTTREESNRQAMDSGTTEEDANKFYDKLINEFLPREKAFFKKLSVSQELFDRTQRADKGMDSGVYVLLLPKPSTFIKYGILNVQGEQSQFLIDNDERIIKYAKLGYPVLVD